MASIRFGPIRSPVGKKGSALASVVSPPPTEWRGACGVTIRCTMAGSRSPFAPARRGTLTRESFIFRSGRQLRGTSRAGVGIIRAELNKRTIRQPHNQTKTNKPTNHSPNHRRAELPVASTRRPYCYRHDHHQPPSSRGLGGHLAPVTIAAQI